MILYTTRYISMFLNIRISRIGSDVRVLASAEDAIAAVADAVAVPRLVSVLLVATPGSWFRWGTQQFDGYSYIPSVSESTRSEDARTLRILRVADDPAQTPSKKLNLDHRDVFLCQPRINELCNK
jgi:hypothetical protein